MSRIDDIACILDSKWIPRAGKYRVKLGFAGSKAETVWMTERQLSQIERLFERTPHGYSTQRCQVVGIWNEKGYYAYARLEEQSFIEPPQYSLKDLEDT